MKKRKYKAITLDTAVNRYVSRNKNKMITIFGSEHNARSILKTQPYFNSDYKDPKDATKDINQFMKYYRKDKKTGQYKYNVAAAELYKAKKEAIGADPLKKYNMHKLNGKISDTYTTYNRYLGQTTNNHQTFDVSIIGYYDMPNEDEILAELEYEISPHTKVRRYEFIDRSLL